MQAGGLEDVVGNALAETTLVRFSIGTTIDTTPTEPVDGVFGHGAAPFGIVFHPAGDRAFVTLQGKGRVVSIDVASRGVERDVEVGVMPTGIAITGDGARLFVSRFLSSAERGEVRELRASDLGSVRTIAIGMDPGPDTEANSRGVPNYLRQVVPSPDGRVLLVPSKKDNVLRGPTRDGQPLTFESSVRTIVSFVDLMQNREVSI